MPELPEVESVRRQLVPQLTGRTVVDVWADVQARFSALDALSGSRVEAVGRRGKFLVLPLAHPEGARELIGHLGMTGSLRVLEPGDTMPSHVRARLTLDDRRVVAYRDPRRFGRLSVVAPGDYADIPTLDGLGPEPLSDAFEAGAFAAGLQRTRAPVKAVLLAQRLVAGVGNIYADEALWRTRIHPASRRVGPRRARGLHRAIREVLAAAIEREGTTFRDYQMVNGESGRYAASLDAYGKAGLPCARCGGALRRTVVAQRGTTYCPACQH